MKSVMKENSSLKYKCNEIQQNSFNNSLVVTGVPQPKNENVFITTQLIGSSLGIRLDESHISNSYRSQTAGKNGVKSNRIIVFSTQIYKDEFIRCRKMKRDFSTADLDKSLENLVKDPNTIYVNEYLTAQNKSLFLKAKEYKKETNIHILWIKNGNIYMRKKEGTRAVLINSESDFQNILCKPSTSHYVNEESTSQSYTHPESMNDIDLLKLPQPDPPQSPQSDNEPEQVPEPESEPVPNPESDPEPAENNEGNSVFDVFCALMKTDVYSLPLPPTWGIHKTENAIIFSKLLMGDTVAIERLLLVTEGKICAQVHDKSMHVTNTIETIGDLVKFIQQMENSREALLRRLGPNAYPFEMEITPLSPPSVQLVPAKEYNGAPIGTSYDVRAYVGSPQTQSIAKITIESINLKVPHLTPNDDIKLQLLTRIKADESMMIPFRRWELHELPALTQGSTIEIWSVKTCSALESPRYVIVFFQTKKADDLHEDVTLFDNANIKYIRLALNSDYYPQERMLLDFSKDQYADAHFNYTEFNKSYHNSQQKRSLVNFNEFKTRPMFVIDCSRRHLGMKSSTVDIKLDIEATTGFPPDTKAYCIIVHDQIIEHLPLSEIVRNIT
ncbi:unnamed protein product [Phaedon cochleariae]|uniref:Uncharacterized protein n=1 Tax=Phaedon cochleariae TaxID=80249 RepID=A0A9N9SHA4_PHACE|nr:unnamed protein product [Phaedon cochleariae]